MKTILKFDYYWQTSLILLMVVYTVFDFTVQSGSHLLYYHFVVGISQLVSFVMRIYFLGAKGKFITVYGFLVIPVWFALIASQINFPFDDIRAGFLYQGFIICPLISFFYPFYIHEADQKYEKCNP